MRIKYTYPTLFTLIILLNINTLNAKDNYVDSMLNLIEETDDMKMQSKYYYRIARKLMQEDIDEAIIYAKKSVSLAKKGNYKPELCKSYIMLATVLESGAFIDESLVASNKALAIAEELDDPELIYYGESRVGNAFRRLAMFDSALVHLIAAHKTAQDRMDDLRFTSAGALNVGGIYAALDDYDKAEQYMVESLELSMQSGDSMDAAYTYSNLGIINRDRGNYDKSLKFYNKAKEIFLRYQNPIDSGYVYTDLGSIYLKMKKPDSAEYYLKKSIEIRERIGDRSELVYSYYFMGENSELKGNLVQAEKFMLKAIDAALANHNNKQTYEGYEGIAEFYERHGQYNKAYKYLNLHNNLRDSLRQAENKDLIEELNTKYQTEKKEKIIQEQQFDITRRNYLLTGSLGVMLLGALLGYSYYRRYKLKQQAKLQEEVLKHQEMATKAVIEAEENERQRIAGDLHDGVGQMMSAARINLSTITSELQFTSQEQRTRFDNALKLVDDSCAEVRTVSHNIMPNALLKNSLAAAVRTFIDKIDERVIKVNLYTEGLNTKIDENVETVLYRVIQECVNNVIKHANASNLDISLIRDDNEISVTVEDNGKGFDKDNAKLFEGIGLKNIKTRVEYLKGNVEWDSAIGRGTVVSINVPLNN